MEATMNENGVITLKAESSLEAYAMRQWMNHQKIENGDNPVSLQSIDSSKLCIDANWPQDSLTGGNTFFPGTHGVMS